MNHLAHALLAGTDESMIVGSLMGDFVRGRIETSVPAPLQPGVQLHRAIDHYTDTHSVTASLRAHFTPPWRRYAGILIDIWFDHLLARDFSHWSATPLDSYSQHLLHCLQQADTWLPEPMQRFIAYMRQNNLPAAYRDLAMIQQVLTGVGHRLRHPIPLQQALPVLQQHSAALQQGFATFYPQVTQFAHTWRQEHGLV